MLGGVGDRLLGDAQKRQAGGRGERVWLAADRQRAGAVVEQRGERIWQRRRVGPQRSDRPARLGQPLVNEPPGVGEQAQRAVDVVALGQHRLRGLYLDPERAQRVGQDIVDLAGDPRALVQRGGALGLELGPAGLGEQRLGLLGLGPVDALVASGQSDRCKCRRIPEHRPEIRVAVS